MKACCQGHPQNAYDAYRGGDGARSPSHQSGACVSPTARIVDGVGHGEGQGHAGEGVYRAIGDFAGRWQARLSANYDVYE